MKSRDNCENCGTPCLGLHELNGWYVCPECTDALNGEVLQELNSTMAELRRERDRAIARSEKVEAERDEARAQAVWAIQVTAPSGWVACAPGGGAEGLRLVDGAWVEQTMCVAEGSRFPTEAEALAAGRALPWWEVEA